MISVCMAAYNGEKYIYQQIDSILCQLDKDDELIISDDGSTDNTINIINSFNDPRIRLIDGPQKGCVANFENAIKHAGGDIILLSDQDDVWKRDKIDAIRVCFNEKPSTVLICHNYDLIDGNGNVLKTDVKKNVTTSFLYNLFKPVLFTGHCMAFRKMCSNWFLPIPHNKYVFHDNWIGLCVLLKKKKNFLYLNQSYVQHRIHGNNVSVTKSVIPWYERIYRRFMLLRYMVSRINK